MKTNCSKCKNFQAPKTCVAPKNMFGLRRKEGMTCEPLRSPEELNKNNNCIYFDKVPMKDRIFKVISMAKSIISKKDSI